MVRLRLEGLEIDDLAARFDMNRTTVIGNLQRQGVPDRRWPGKTLSTDDLKLAGRLYEGGFSQAAVGEQFGVDRRYLRRAFRSIEVVVRTPGRQSREHRNAL